MRYLFGIFQQKTATLLNAAFLILLVFLSLSTPNICAHDPVSSEQIAVEERNGQTIPRDLIFFDELGDPIALRSIMSTPVILNLAYYTCKDICPQIFAGIAQVLPKLKLTPQKDYRVITISFDENDTPQIARETKINYLKSFDTPFPDDAWRFLTGQKEQIEALTKSVGFTFQREGHEFIHPVTLIILSPAGTISRYIYVPKSAYGVAYPVNFSALELETSLTEAAQGKIGAAVKRAFLYCFPHEPKNQAEFFRLLSMIGAATLIGIVAFFLFLKKTSSKKDTGTTHDAK
jgi:protein SCO1/2